MGSDRQLFTSNWLTGEIDIRLTVNFTLTGVKFTKRCQTVKSKVSKWNYWRCKNAVNPCRSGHVSLYMMRAMAFGERIVEEVYFSLSSSIQPRANSHFSSHRCCVQLTSTVLSLIKREGKWESFLNLGLNSVVYPRYLGTQFSCVPPTREDIPFSIPDSSGLNSVKKVLLRLNSEPPDLTTLYNTISIDSLK